MSEFTKKIYKRWKPIAPHTDSTLDYALSALFEACHHLDADESSYKALETLYNQLKEENKNLKHEIGDWLRWCGYLEKGYRPVGLIETSTQILKDNA